MKTQIKKILWSLVLAVVAVVCLPQVFAVEVEAITDSGTCGEDLTWTLNTETGELIINGTGAMCSYDNSWNESPWYADWQYIKSIIISDGVTYIGSAAFYNCRRLVSITIPDSVTSIGIGAFDFCPSLKNVYYIGDVAGWCAISFSGIFSNPMYYADNLYFNDALVSGNLTIPDGVTTIGDCAFYKCTGLTSITILDSVTSIGSSAFSGCTGLTSITIPDSVTSIGANAFYNCTGLTSITIPDSVTSIGANAFSGCTGLISITIPDSVTFIDSSAFSGCTSLTSVHYTGDVAGWCAISFSGIFSNPMCYADNLYFNDALVSGNLTIPDGVTTIGANAFSGCTGLTSITIPDSVTMIGANAFSGCTGLTSITIPDSVTSIGNSAFRYCTGLTSITIPNSVTSICANAFYNCTGLTSITIPDSVTSIGSYAFEGCTRLTSITIPDSVTSIGANAFYNCTGLSAVCFTGTEEDWKAIGYGDWSTPEPTIFFNHTTHLYNVEEITEQPTCTTAGSKTFSCVCGAVERTEVIPATGHSLKRITVKPTCTQDGKTCYQCQNCLTEFSVNVVPATGHTAGEWVAQTEPTCTEDGVAVKKCTVCQNELETQAIPATGHTSDEWETKTEPTCTEDGVAVKKCTVCETEFETQAIPATGHTAGEWETETAPTCEKDGVSVKKCTVCQTELETQAVPATGHTAGEWKTKTAPTCVKDGVSVKKCTVCQTELETQSIPATGHSYKEQTITSPTCIKEGEMKYTCHCGDSYTVTIPVLDHDEVRYYTAPTCLDPGMEYYICNSCGNMIGDMEIIPETCHIYGWAVVKAPTATESGSKKQVCTGCGEETCVVETIPATGFETTNGMVVDYANNIVYGLDAGVNSLDSYTNVVADGYEWTYTLGQFGGFGTGTKATLKNSDETVAEYIVLIYGDLNGDGWYDGEDAFLVNLLVKGMLDKDDVGEAIWTAADCNHDGVIDETDVDLLSGAGLKLNDVDQSKTAAELATNSNYIEYVMLIDQSAGMNPGITSDVDDMQQGTTDTNTTPEQPADEINFEAIITTIFDFIKKLFTLVFSFIIK